jgi:hypothetical protein
MGRATLILREKVIDEDGNFVEMAIWRVPVSPANPGGVRYRLAFVRRGATEPSLLYDNHHPKGHHRHLEGVEEAYAFVDVDRLIADFVADIRRVGGVRTWPER